MLKKITQKEFDAIPRNEDGYKLCPAADYSAINSIPKWCSFAKGCKFAEQCRFAGGCRFAEGCSLEGVNLIGPTVYVAGGYGSENRTTYGIPHKGGVFVRCGCARFKSLDKFRAKVKEVLGGTPIEAEYLIVADLFEARWRRETATA